MRQKIVKKVVLFYALCGLILCFLGVSSVYGANSGFVSAKNISVNAMVSGSLETSNAVDYYKFTLPQAGYIYLEFSHTYVDDNTSYWNTKIYNGSYEEIISRNSNGKKLTSTYATIGLPAGTYYAKISRGYYWSNANYQFCVHYLASDNWEKEENESFETANPISTGAVVNGSIRENSDKDFYRFTVPQNGKINIDFSHEYVDDDTSYWYITVYNGEFEELISRSAKGKKIQISYADLGVSAGTYYIEIVKGYYWDDVSYSFTVKHTASEDWEKEKNESYETATNLTTGTVINGSIRENSDRDFYIFKISQAGYIYIDFGHEFINSNSSYWNITVYNSDYEELMSRNAYGQTMNYSYGRLGVDAGTYYIKIVKGYYWDDVAYNMKVNYTPSSFWEKELNEGFDTSDTISLGTYVNGGIRENNDVDCYQVSVSKSGYINTNFNHEYINDNNRFWKIVLYNSSYNELSSIYATGKESIASSSCYVTPGTYYIKVSCSYYWSDVTYRLKVNYKFTSSKPGIKAEVTGSQNVKLSWNRVSNASGYEIYRAKGKNGKFTLLKKITSGSKCSYTDKKVTLGKTYCYKIRAYHASAGKTSYSNYSPKKSVKIAVSKVKITKIKSPSKKRVQLTWKKVSGANGYEIYRSNTKNGKYKKIASISSGKKVSYTDKKVGSKKKYYYKIRAYKKSGKKKYYGEYSSKKSVKVK